MSEEGIKALLGTIEEPESEEYSEKDIFEKKDAEETAFERYDFIDLLNCIGKPEFKNEYMLFNDEKYIFEKRRNFAREILEKINDVYDIEYTLTDQPSTEDVDNVFKFLEFLEYDYINFISDVWKFMDVDLRSDIRDFCMRNAEKIIKIIDDQIDSHYLSPLIAIFLRTYNKDDMIMMFIKMTENARMLIVLKNTEENF